MNMATAMFNSSRKRSQTNEEKIPLIEVVEKYKKLYDAEVAFYWKGRHIMIGGEGSTSRRHQIGVFILERSANIIATLHM